MSDRDESNDDDQSKDQGPEDSVQGDGDDAGQSSEKPEDAESQAPKATHVVHLYRNGEFLRTLDREFTESQAEAFVQVYNGPSRYFGRKAVVGLIGVEPVEELV